MASAPSVEIGNLLNRLKIATSADFSPEFFRSPVIEN